MTAEAQPDLDLDQSLAEGLQQANALESAMEEIKGVLTELDATVKKGTNSVVSISLESPRRTTFGQYLGVLEFFLRSASVSHIDPEDRDVGELEVLAKIDPPRGHEDTRRLCSMTLSEEGYPVTVDSGTHVEGCYDAVALRRSLAAILRRPMTGRKLRALIQRHEQRQSSAEVEGVATKQLGDEKL